MAGSTSKPVICVPSQGQIGHFHGPTQHFFNVVSRVGSGRLSRYCTFRLQEKTKTAAFSVRGCGEDDFGVTEEDQEFVKVLRESQPYFLVHRGRVFVIVISAELVASPYLDAILKVPSFSIYLQTSYM